MMRNKIFNLSTRLSLNYSAWIIAGVLIAFVFVAFTEFIPAGPDSMLYQGLSENIANGTGYIDNIRNDFILPPVGHPFLLFLFSQAGITDVWFMRIMAFLAIFITLMIFRKTGLNIIVSSALAALLYILMPPFIINGIEISLFLSSLILILSLIHLVMNQSISNALLSCISLVLFVIIRPILLPAVVLFIPAAIIWMIFRKQVIRILFPFLIAFTTLYGFVAGVSHFLYNDSRLVQGTYGSITLYCSFNEFINLKSTYYSERWKEVPDSLRQEGIEPMMLQKGSSWQHRDGLLKMKAIEFIKSNPSEALSAYLWRIKKFSFGADSHCYKAVFFSWFILSIIAIIFSFRKMLTRKWVWLLVLLISLPAYLIMFQAVFVYCGTRYYVIPLVFTYICTILIFRIIVYKTEKNIQMKYKKLHV